MAGVRKLRKMQIGPEATAGTPVAATEVWRGMTNGIVAQDVIQAIEEDIGNLGGANRTHKSSIGARAAIPETPLTAEQFVWLLQAGVEAQQTGVADGAGSGKIYTHDFPLTTLNTIKTLTVEAGNNQKAFEMEYAFVPEFSVQGEPDALVMMSGMFTGRQKTATTFTALSVAAVHEFPFNQSSLYLDAIGGTIGSTQISCALLGFTIDINTGLVPIQAGDGSLLYCAVQQVGWEVRANVVFRHTNDADTEEANAIAETARLMQIKLEGEDLATGGTDYSKFSVLFNLPGKWAEPLGELEDRDGNDILTGVFVSKYDPTAAAGPSIIVVNETASYWA